MRRKLAGCLCSLLVLAGCQVVRIDRPGTTPPEDATTDQVREFVRLLNRHRQTKGCPVLTWDGDIARVAEAHSAEMARYGYLSHTNRARQSPFDRLAKAGIRFRRAAENIAEGQPSGAEVLRAWLDSPGHRVNIEECRYSAHGVGKSGFYWTHVFVQH